MNDRTTDSRKPRGFQAANQELELFLGKADPSADARTWVDPAELDGIWLRMVELAPKISRRAAHRDGAENLPDEIKQYVAKLRSLKALLERIRGEMLYRQAQLGQARTQLERLEGFVHAYHKTV